MCKLIHFDLFGCLRTVYDYAGKADLNKGYGNPKRKFGGTTLFLGIIKQQLF